MRAAAAVVLLASFAAHAQHVQPENVYAPLGGGHAVAATSAGAVIAWRGLDPATGQLALRAGAVDRNGALVSSTTIGVPDGDAFAPTLARANDSILLGFVHRHAFLGDRVAAVPLDEQGRPNGPIRRFLASSGAAPLLVSRGATYTLWDLRRRYELDRTGAILSEGDTDFSPDVLPFEGGELIFSRDARQEQWHCGFTQCGILPAMYSVTWAWRAETLRGASVTRNWYAAGVPAAAGTAREIALISNGLRGVEGLFLRNGDIASQFLVPGSVAVDTSPSIAFDGSRYLIAFDDFGDLYGALVDSSMTIAHRFPISTSGRSESAPRVVALSRGRFLVTYNHHDSLAGRIITTNDAPPTRRRSVR